MTQSEFYIYLNRRKKVKCVRKSKAKTGKTFITFSAKKIFPKMIFASSVTCINEASN